ncbi:hypothetical protein FJ251_10170 [bacterium]|nr:hypothetical protein [bacterium]
MIRIVCVVLIAGTGLLVVYAEGLYWLAFWNLLPLVLAILAIVRSGDVRPSLSATTFAGITTLSVALTHAAWVFDWGGTQTGSSTSGLVFLFSPIYSILLATAAWAVTKGIERLGGRRNATQQGAPADAGKPRR